MSLHVDMTIIIILVCAIPQHTMYPWQPQAIQISSFVLDASGFFHDTVGRCHIWEGVSDVIGIV